MAGAGFRTFAAGEVLTASNVNTYLMEQSIMNFAGTAARSSAISSPSEGMFAYLQDTNSLTFYNGSAWVNAGSAIAGTALSSGTATSGQVLTANGSGAVTFSTPSSGLTLINTTSFSAVASQSAPANTFSATYENYLVLINLTTNSANDGDVYFRLRSGSTDKADSYYWGRRGWTISGTGTDGNGNNVNGITVMTQDSSIAGYSHIQLNIFSPFAAQKTKVGWLGSAVTDAGALYFQFGGGVLDNNTSYDSFSLVNQNGTSTGKMAVYGYSV